MVARLVVAFLVPEETPVLVAVDDTLLHRYGPKVAAASWFHDGAALGTTKVGYGNNWVIAAIVVSLPFLSRPLALPVGFALVIKGETDSRLALARRLVERLAAALPDRRLNVVADSAYTGKALRGLPGRITWTSRLRCNAALFELAPPRTGRRGRPRKKGHRLPKPASLAGNLEFTASTVFRYGEQVTVAAAARRWLWYGAFGPQEVQIVLVRDRPQASGYDIALVSTDLDATPAELVARYAARWSIERGFEDAKDIAGVGQARNRTRMAVARTVPFELVITTVAICWYATAGHHPDDVAQARARAPWYASKTQPSVEDMLAKLRRVLIATQFRPGHPQPATPAEINTLRLAWADTAA